MNSNYFDELPRRYHTYYSAGAVRTSQRNLDPSLHLVLDRNHVRDERTSNLKISKKRAGLNPAALSVNDCR